MIFFFLKQIHFFPFAPNARKEGKIACNLADQSGQKSEPSE